MLESTNVNTAEPPASFPDSQERPEGPWEQVVGGGLGSAELPEKQCELHMCVVIEK